MDLNNAASQPNHDPARIRSVIGAILGIALYLTLAFLAELRNDENLLSFLPWIIKLVLEAPMRFGFVLFLDAETVHGPVVSTLVSILTSLPFGLLGSILASGKKPTTRQSLLYFAIFFYLLCICGTLLTLLAI